MVFKSPAEFEQEVQARIEKIHVEVDTFCVLKHHRALPHQRVAALLRKLANYLDPPPITHIRGVTKTNRS
jgi:hypothetical protein